MPRQHASACSSLRRDKGYAPPAALAKGPWAEQLIELERFLRAEARDADAPAPAWLNEWVASAWSDRWAQDELVRLCGERLSPRLLRALTAAGAKSSDLWGESLGAQKRLSRRRTFGSPRFLSAADSLGWIEMSREPWREAFAAAMAERSRTSSGAALERVGLAWAAERLWQLDAQSKINWQGARRKTVDAWISCVSRDLGLKSNCRAWAIQMASMTLRTLRGGVGPDALERWTREALQIEASSSTLAAAARALSLQCLAAKSEGWRGRALSSAGWSPAALDKEKSLGFRSAKASERLAWALALFDCASRAPADQLAAWGAAMRRASAASPTALEARMALACEAWRDAAGPQRLASPGTRCAFAALACAGHEPPAGHEGTAWAFAAAGGGGGPALRWLLRASSEEASAALSAARDMTQSDQAARRSMESAWSAAEREWLARAAERAQDGATTQSVGPQRPGLRL
jgi:hypothetical protein